MNKCKWCLFFFFFFVITAGFSQNYRDKVIQEIINPIFNKMKTSDKEEYGKVKELILKLDADYGYETDLKKRLIEFSFFQNDLDFFKNELSVLVEKHGFNVAYMNGNEAYFDEIMKGSLSVWFKQMYLKNHFVWLEGNFEKQISQRKLNEIQMKDQLVGSFAMKIREIPGLDSLHLKSVSEKLNEFYFKNISEVYKICRLHESYPSGKSFGLIQNGFQGAFLHNYWASENIERIWILFEPYIKNAYLKNDLDYTDFKNYDIYTFSHFGYQKYGLITIEDLPLFLRSKAAELQSVPIENIFFVDKTKREMGWK